ncbi:MAG: hypothetical protein H6733_07650 [Alphaproteobacteria bacterium]|nr:hypothetical protein [Alphaproteobacteria bacterium]
MTPTLLLGLQITLGFAIAIEAVRAPSVRAWLVGPPERVLPGLLWVHVGRFLPLGILAPGQVDGAVPRAVLHVIAWGDAISAVLALAAIARLRAGAADARGLAWAFALVGSVDIVAALGAGLGAGIQHHALGVGWFVLVGYVPVVCVAQALVVWTLMRAGAGVPAATRRPV